MPRKLHYREEANPDFVYFPACVTRIFGASGLHKDDLITVVLRLAGKAGIRVSLPEEAHGLCCSQIWEHKGNPAGQRLTANRTIESFYKWSGGGRIPIFCDTTSCTHTLLFETGGDILTPRKPGEIQAIENHGYHTMAQRSCFTPNQSYSPEKSDFTSSDLFLSDHGTYSGVARYCP